MNLMRCFVGIALSVGICSAALAQITGTVKLEGNPPVMQPIQGIANDPNCAKLHKNPVTEETVVVGNNGELQNVVVSIKPAAGQKVPAAVPGKPAVLDQKGCVYHPHVVAVMVGQEVDVKSSDPFLHNVHGTCTENDVFNFGQMGPATKKLTPFTKPETFKIKCDVHPWMAAWVRVLDNPFFGVTGEDGKYSIDATGLPDGDYTLIFWQERYGENEQKVTVKKGKATADFSFKSNEKAQP
jgi:plastocyanin